MKLIIEKNVPFPQSAQKELTSALFNLNDGESVYLDFAHFQKTSIDNAIASARIRILSRGLCLKSRKDNNGKRVWAFKK